VSTKIPPLGILQGRLTPSVDGSIQFFPKDNWKNEFAIAQDIGFDCIELLVKSDSWQENPLLDLSHAGELGRLSRNYGISLPSVHGFYNTLGGYPIILADIAYRASLLSVKTILVSFFGDNVLNNEADYDFVRCQLRKVLLECERTGISIGIETEMIAPKLLDFIKSLDSPAVGIYYDIGNMASMGVNVANEIRTIGNLLFGVHVKDREANGGKTVPLGEGCVKFKETFIALKEVGYNRPFIIQGARSSEIDDITLNERYYKFCHELLVEIYEKGEVQ